MSESDHKRSSRVGPLIQQELSRLLFNGLKDPRVGFVTVTEVRVTDDFGQAKVYVSIYGEPEKRQESLQGLKAAAGYLKRELAAVLKLRHMPDLFFVLDESLDKAQRLHQVMNAISRGESELPPAVETSFVPVKTPRAEMTESAKVLEAMAPPPPPPKKPSKRGSRRHKKTTRR